MIVFFALPFFISLSSIFSFELLFSATILIFFVLLYGLLSYLLSVLSYNNWRYEFTHNAIKIEKGIIWKRYISIPYDRVQNIDINRGILARMLGISDLQIQTAGYSAVSRGQASEGRLPGLDPIIAENLRDNLIDRVSGGRQGL